MAKKGKWLSNSEAMKYYAQLNGPQPGPRRSGGGNSRARAYWAEIERQAQQAMSRPEGELEAGNVLCDGRPGYYEDGGQSGVKNQRDLYTGPNGPFGPDHVHLISEDEGETWRKG